MDKKVKKIISIVVCAAILVGVLGSLAACGKKTDKVTLSDIYTNSNTFNAFTGYEKLSVLPSGWSVYLDSSSTTSGSANENSDIGYIKSLDAFVVNKTDVAGDTVLSLVRMHDDTIYFDGGIEGMLFREKDGICAIRVKGRIIAVKYKSGSIAVYGDKANLLLSRTKTDGAKSVGIDECVKLLDTNLCAINSTYDKNGAKGYTSIYRFTKKGELETRGELVAYVKNDADDLDYVNGFDNKYVSVVGNSTSAYMYKIPETANGNPEKLTGGNGVIAATSSEDNYYYEVTYLGNSKFYIYTDYTVTSSDDYTYYDGTDYYKSSRYIYYPETDKLESYTDNNNKIFMKLTNTYYDDTKADIDVTPYLNKGYTYAQYGMNLFVNDGVTTGFYDQYILDSDLNIVMSLTGNYGEKLLIDDRDDITVFDLLMTSNEGVYYVPYMPSTVKYYDKDGKLLGSNDEYEVVAQNLTNGIAVAQIEKSDDTYMYGAFDTTGKVIVDFKYTSLTSFRGYYAIGTRKDESNKTVLCLVGRDGKEYPLMNDLSNSLSDIALDTSKKYIYKIGTYMFSKVIEGKTYYGIKNLDTDVKKNVIIPASMTEGAIMYSPSNSTSDVFVFEKITATDGVITYVINQLK